MSFVSGQSCFATPGSIVLIILGLVASSSSSSSASSLDESGPLASLSVSSSAFVALSDGQRALVAVGCLLFCMAGKFLLLCNPGLFCPSLFEVFFDSFMVAFLSRARIISPFFFFFLSLTRLHPFNISLTRKFPLSRFFSFNSGATTVHSMYVGMVSASRRVHNDNNNNNNNETKENEKGQKKKQEEKEAKAHDSSTAAAAAAPAVSSSSSSSLHLEEKDEPVLMRTSSQTQFFLSKAREMVVLTMALVFVAYAALGLAGALRHRHDTHINTGVNIIRDFRNNVYELFFPFADGTTSHPNRSGGDVALLAVRVVAGLAAIVALVYQKLAVLPLIFSSVDNMFSRASGKVFFFSERGRPKLLLCFWSLSGVRNLRCFGC